MTTEATETTITTEATTTDMTATTETITNTETKKATATKTKAETVMATTYFNNDDKAESCDWQHTNNAQYPIKYADSSMTIRIDKVWYRHAWCYVAQVKMSDYSRMTTVCANGKFGNGTETCLQAAKRTNAILAVNACHSNIEQNIPVVRDGEVYNAEGVLCNFPACYNKYTGVLNGTNQLGLFNTPLKDAVANKELTDGFCFGPAFDMVNIENNDDGTSGGRAQRTFIGTNGQAGNIVIVVSEGRYVDDVSEGLTYKECAEVLKHYGCSFGAPLDGGGSSTMVYNNQILNHLPKERKIVDFVVFR